METMETSYSVMPAWEVTRKSVRRDLFESSKLVFQHPLLPLHHNVRLSTSSHPNPRPYHLSRRPHERPSALSPPYPHPNRQSFHYRPYRRLLLLSSFLSFPQPSQVDNRRSQGHPPGRHHFFRDCRRVNRVQARFPQQEGRRAGPSPRSASLSLLPDGLNPPQTVHPAQLTPPPALPQDGRPASLLGRDRPTAPTLPPQPPFL
jgi:hypothetical protein